MASAITLTAVAVVVVFVAFIVVGLLKFLSLTSAAIIPLVLGFFLSLFFKPYYRKLLSWVKNPTVALVLMLLTVFIPFGLILWYAGSILIDQLSNLISQGPALFAQVTNWFQATFPKLNALLANTGMKLGNVNELYAQYGGSALKAGTKALKCLSGLITILLTLLFFVFFIMTKERKGGEVVKHLPFLKDDTKKFMAEMIDAFFDILVSFFQRQTIICLIEGLMYGIGFALVGLPYGFLIGFALGVLNLIPLFGTCVCMPIALPLAYFLHDGSVMRLVLVLLVWGFGQVLDGYFITPKIQGNKTGLGYAGVIFSFVFWAALLGPLLGMLLAIPLSAFWVVLWRGLKSRYIRPVV